MRTRLLTALAAFIMAIVGALLVSSYVQGADARAMAGVKTENVLVVQAAVPAGTPTEQLAQFVKPQPMPVSVVAEGALKDLSAVAGKVTAVDLVPSEQLLDSRLVDPGKVSVGGAVPVPKGMQEITVRMTPEHALGGKILPGDTVGIFVTMDQLNKDKEAVAVTHLVFQKVLVTRVQGVPGPPAEGVAPESAPVPDAPMDITFARTSADAERIVFATQKGSLWLSKEPKDADESGTAAIVQDGFFE